MDTVLRNIIWIECGFFVDDVNFFSSSSKEHAQRLENVLHRFDGANLQLHPRKCVFAQPQVNYLSYILSESGISH